MIDITEARKNVRLHKVKKEIQTIDNRIRCASGRGKECTFFYSSTLDKELFSTLEKEYVSRGFFAEVKDDKKQGGLRLHISWSSGLKEMLGRSY